MYYILKRKLTDESIVIDPTSHWDYSLRRGRRMDPNFPIPMTFNIDTEISGSEMPSLFLSAGPLFIKELYEVFTAIGVDNLEVFPAVITNPDTNKKHDNYLAVNIIGLISCADMTASEYDELADSYVMRRLVISPPPTNSPLMFRLAEDPLQILISQNVVSKFPSEKFQDIVLEEVAETS